MKKIIKINLLLILFIIINIQTKAQDTLILREICTLSQYINFNKLSNIKQIKQIEHNITPSIDPNFTINFNKDNSVKNLISEGRDSSFIETFDFNWVNKNYLELARCYISLPNDYDYSFRPKTINNDSLSDEDETEYDTVRGVTSNDVQKYYFYNDTIMTYVPLFEHDTNKTNDTTFLLLNKNKIIKRIEYHSNYNYATIKKHTSELVVYFFYDEKGRYSKIINNIFANRYNYHNNQTEIQLTETDTIYYIYNEKENIVYEITKGKDLFIKEDKDITYGLTQYIYENDTVLHIKYYNSNKKLKPKRLSAEAYVVYNKQGLPIIEKEIEVNHFLGFRKRNVYLDHTFEYTYWN